MYSSFEIQEAQDQALTYPTECRSNLSPRMHFGYWWDGPDGNYGVLLDGKDCWECVDDGQCSADKKCDVVVDGGSYLTYPNFMFYLPDFVKMW